MRIGSVVRVAWAVLVGIGIGQGALPAAHDRPISTLAASAYAAPAARPARRDAATSLPDSVLARVGKDRDITRTAFLASWRDSHRDAPPDSLTPASARRFLEVLIDRELLAEAASHSGWKPTAEEQVQLDGLADRMAMGLTLDSLLVSMPGDRSAAAAKRGIEVRDSIVGGLGLEFDKPLVDRLAKAWAALPRPTADSSVQAQLRMMEQLPVVSPADTGRVVLRSKAGNVRAADLLSAWTRLPAVYRPRVETAAQVEDLGRNVLFERLVRERSEAWHMKDRPPVRALIARQRENLAIARYVEEKIGRVPPDEAGFTRWFEQHRAEYALPTRVQVVRLAFDDRESATRMAVTLRDSAEARLLAERSERSGVRYRAQVSAASDSILFRAALRAGPGSVVGPIQRRGEWVVARVEAVLPGRPRDLAEVQTEAHARWTAEENERRLVALADELAKTTPVTVNEPAVRAAGAKPAGAAAQPTRR